jgi:hypothetical protein
MIPGVIIVLGLRERANVEEAGALYQFHSHVGVSLDVVVG